MEFFVMVFGGVLLYGIISAMTTAPGRSLQSKFVSLGTLAGRTKGEIIAVVGPPNSVSALPDGKSVLQWMATGYHIALVFDGETCDGVSHEFAAGQ